MKFWNMPDGPALFMNTDKKIVAAYEPASGLPSVTYQQIPWANFTTVFSSALASKTGPAVSGGGGTQPFQYSADGYIAYADDLLDSWKSNGLYDDFLPGLLDTMKTNKGYVALPYNLDVRVMWYSKSLMEKAGAEVPTDWQSYENACAALKKIGVYGFGTGSGQGNSTGSQVMVALMINNGGGLFDENHEPNCVTSANVEALDFILGLVKNGYSDPAAAGYTTDNVQSQWKADKFGLGWDTGSVNLSVGGTKTDDMQLGSPLTGPSGKKGSIYFVNPIMMFKETPSQKGSEAFVTYYYKHMAPLWTKNTGIGLPPLKSIVATKEFQANQNNVKLIKEWQPICKTWAAPGGTALFPKATVVDGTPTMLNFAQSVLNKTGDAKSLLTTLQKSLKDAMHKS